MISKRTVFFMLGGVATTFVVLAATGKRFDAAGTALTQRGLVLPIRFGATVESAAVGAFVAWLTR
jgi:hypothetical protein